MWCGVTWGSAARPFRRFGVERREARAALLRWRRWGKRQGGERETGGACKWGPPVREPKKRGGVGKVGPAGLLGRAERVKAG